MALLTLELINKTLIGTCQVLGSKLRAFIYWFVLTKNVFIFMKHLLWYVEFKQDKLPVKHSRLSTSVIL